LRPAAYYLTGFVEIGVQEFLAKKRPVQEARVN